METGHAKNVANFFTLISYCIGYGTQYNPVSNLIKIPALQAKHTAGGDAITLVDTTAQPYDEAVNIRQGLFKPLRSLATRIIAAAVGCDLSPAYIADLKKITRKLQGRRVSEKTEKSHSASQMSFDSRLENFSKLIIYLTAETDYAPNETDLTVTALGTLHTSMETANETVISLHPAWSNARISRDEILYHKTTGMFKLVKQVKAYIKSVFGADSPQYLEINAIEFKRPGD